MNMHAFLAIEKILADNGLPIPEGQGKEKLDKIREIVRKYEMPDDVRQRLQNLLALQ